MDMDVRTLQNYKMLADMIPELDSPKRVNQILNDWYGLQMEEIENQAIKFVV